MRREIDLNYHIHENFGSMIDEKGEHPVDFIHNPDNSPLGDILDDIEVRTGTRPQVIGEISTDGRVKTFGFSGSWKGSTWVPEGPRPNWIEPAKKLN